MALGIMGISLDDLERLTPGEFNATREAWEEFEGTRNRSSWEQSRYVAYHAIVPHAKKGFRITDLGRFPWEKDVFKQDTPVKTLSPEERERMIGKYEGVSEKISPGLHVPDTLPQEYQETGNKTSDKNNPDERTDNMK